IPKATPGAKVCFVFDDGGLHAENVKKYTSLPFPLTVAVLPKLSESEACAKTVLSSGKELILHQPMQAHDYPDGKTPNPGPGAILPGMSMDEAAAVIRENLDSLGASVAGFNNHEGSLITEDAELMGAVLSVAQEKKIRFIDSRTTSQSAVPNVAESLGMKYIGRFAPFVDNEIDRNTMLEMIRKGLEVANRDGYAVIIAHVDKSVEILPSLLQELYPSLVEAGYTLTTPSKL
ncbi:MAG: divergent polysaccharide deacetylase family protein, partial [Treponema sp.]|nr:divergent polysaccharide deacetylase family protein [Treponema sp.]